jgi:hypothetical protein
VGSAGPADAPPGSAARVGLATAPQTGDDLPNVSPEPSRVAIQEQLVDDDTSYRGVPERRLTLARPELPDLDARLFATSGRDRTNIAASSAVGVLLIATGMFTDNLDVLVWGFYAAGAVALALAASLSWTRVRDGRAIATQLAEREQHAPRAALQLTATSSAITVSTALTDTPGATEDLTLPDIEDIELQRGQDYHRLTARLRDGSTRTLLPGITSAVEAESLHSRLRSHLQSHR